MTSTVPVSRLAVWVVLYGILVGQTYRYQTDVVFYGEYVHWTGLHATHLLLIALVITPLRRLLPRVRWIQRFSTFRRDIGVAVCAYSVAHTIAYLHRQPGLQEIVDDAVTPGFLAGWIALVVFLPLAATSNDYSVHRLGRNWKRLHSIVYGGAILTMMHWIITAFDPAKGYLYLAVLLLLLGLRAIRPNAASKTGSQST